MITPLRIYSEVMEASSKEDKAYMTRMDKHDIHQINGQAIQNLYDLTIQRSNIDFGDIPDSAGDLEKCKYYKSTKECLDVIDEMYQKNRITDDSTTVIRRAISNVLQFRQQFMTGFRMKHDFVMLSYNALVMAIIDSTDMVIHSYINFILSADTTYKLNTVQDKKRGVVCLDSLRAFNQSCDNGTFAQSLKYMIDAKTSNLIETEIVITGVIIAGLISIVPIIRELIYFYYHSRVQISDYLKMQADFLEMNKLAVEASSRPPQERKQIIKKQEKVISDLRRRADKIMIDHVDTNDVVKKKVKDESSIFSLASIDKQLSKNKLANNDIMIL